MEKEKPHRSCCLGFLLIFFVIFELTSYASSKTWVTYRGSHEKNLIFPGNIPFNVHDLYLDHNLIETVDSIDLNFTSLVYLNLSYNVISKISPEAFINVKKLKVLDLSHNRIDGSLLTTETFKKLESLEHLILRGNPLGIIRHEVFLPTYFSRVQYAIDFSGCSIHTIEPNSLVYLDKLTSLDLSHNNLSRLYPDTFLGLYNTKLLNLSHNFMERVSSRMFHYLNVSVIDLSSNRISTLEEGCFSKINHLQYLNLSDNRLATQPKDQFGDRYLSEIDLSNNQFETFDTQLLSEKVRKYLRVLRMADSSALKRIQSGGGKGFEGLEKLFLDNNRALIHIESSAFASSSKTLRVAHLKNTMLESISQNMVQWQNMTSYTISTTNLNCDCHMKWILDKSLFNRKNAYLICVKPVMYRGTNLFHISKEYLVCSGGQVLMLLGALMVLVLLIGLIVAFSYWLKRRKKTCQTCGRKHEKHGKYVSVYSKDVDEPETRIIDEKVELIEAADV